MKLENEKMVIWNLQIILINKKKKKKDFRINIKI